MCYQTKRVIAVLALWLIMLLFYYNIVYNIIPPLTTKYFGGRSATGHIVEKKSLLQYNGRAGYLIDTTGCVIPDYSKSMEFTESEIIRSTNTCYERAIHVEKSSHDEITFRINYTKIVKKEGQKVNCKYRFALRSNERGKEDFSLRYTPYEAFENGETVKLKEEVITVECSLLSPDNKIVLKYKDAYLVLKKKPNNIFSTSNQVNGNLVKQNMNVLIIGLDTMSRGRAYHSLPKTVAYLKDNKWLEYRGYQKVAMNTFPNVMAMLTGVNASMAYKACGRGMDRCEYNMIWNKFSDVGYTTAYGEDYIRLPDTFSAYKGFTIPPTDHYIRPLFLTGERERGNTVCTGSKPSALHILDYALQFTQAYKKDGFFGFFWINSIGHNLINLPKLFEDNLINFFENLKNSGVLENTFVFLLSDHGVRFGRMRKQRYSYYEERLPMFFMWVPDEYRERYPREYYNLNKNQFRLTTPYDVHETLNNFVIMGDRYGDDFLKLASPKACPQCKSLTIEIGENRTCTEASVDPKWCTCHALVSIKDYGAKRSVELAANYIKDSARKVKTQSCTRCSPLKLKSILRSDRYDHGNKTYYVVAFNLSPGDMEFEATVERFGDEFTILQPTDTIGEYNAKGKCAINIYERKYCMCEFIKSCKKS